MRTGKNHLIKLRESLALQTEKNVPKVLQLDGTNSAEKEDQSKGIKSNLGFKE